MGPTNTLTTLHHLSLGLISLTPTSGLNLTQVYNTIHLDFLQHTSTSWHTQLSTYLTTLGSSSIASTHHLLLSSHPHLSSTYPTSLTLRHTLIHQQHNITTQLHKHTPCTITPHQHTLTNTITPHQSLDIYLATPLTYLTNSSSKGDHTSIIIQSHQAKEG